MQTYKKLFSLIYLRATWHNEFEAFKNSDTEKNLIILLKNWSDKKSQNETQAEQNFVQKFFVDIFSYSLSGSHDSQQGFTLENQYSIEKAGQKGGGGRTSQTSINYASSSILLSSTVIICC